jgi:hypothetical protein
MHFIKTLVGSKVFVVVGTGVALNIFIPVMPLLPALLIG